MNSLAARSGALCGLEDPAVLSREVLRTEPELPLDLAEHRFGRLPGRALEVVQCVIQIEADPAQVGWKLLRHQANRVEVGAC